eukprot:8415269-Pyramimonas_sp.AAC.1
MLEPPRRRRSRWPRERPLPLRVAHVAGPPRAPEARRRRSPRLLGSPRRRRRCWRRWGPVPQQPQQQANAIHSCQ